MTLPYFNPASGTVNVQQAINNGPPANAPVMTGIPRNMVVACDLSRVIYGFRNGVKRWQRAYPSTWPRGMDIYKEVLFVANGANIDLLCPWCGQVYRSITVPSSGGAINGLRVSESGGDTYVTLSLDATGVGTVRIYKLTGTDQTNWALTHYLTSPQTAAYPRDAVVAAGWCFVADTFGHRVYGMALGSAGGAMRDSTDVYYPNSIDVRAANIIRICAEHENRVFDWQYDTNPDIRTMVACAPQLPFSDITKTKADIVAAESGTVDAASTFTPKKTVAAIECSGANTVYSPNSARTYGNELLIADTDNHRVVVRDATGIVTEATGFVNPVNALFF